MSSNNNNNTTNFTNDTHSYITVNKIPNSGKNNNTTF
jgi:hypothetical protein